MKLKTNNDKLLCDMKPEARSENEVRDEEQNPDEQPSHVVYEVDVSN